MKKLYYYFSPLIILSFFLLNSSATHAQKVVTVYDQLLTASKEWQNQPDVPAEYKVMPASRMTPNELHTFHIFAVEKILRKRKVDNLSCEQQANRKLQLDLLHQYGVENKCPVNYSHANAQPVFIDAYNTYCAAGYMMSKSGADDMAREISRTQNYSYLEDITHPGLMQWVENSGLLFGELAWIQPFNCAIWPSLISEMHYNNSGPDQNEYIEIHQGECMGIPCDTIKFYDHNDVLYKTLKVSDMQSFSYSFKYYQFPAGEDFKDSGYVRLISKNPASVSILSENKYNANSVLQTDYNIASFGGAIRQKLHPIGENEFTPEGTSLNLVGTYPDWTMVSLSATRGYLNPLTFGPLPVSLAAFDYSFAGKSVELNWKTASEFNSKSFIIERSSDGTSFESIGEVVAVGNSNTTTTYHFADQLPSYINHYRLKQVDKDGRSAYSKILYVKVPRSNPITIIGNPVKDKLQLDLKFESNISATIKIYDMRGKEYSSLKAKPGSSIIEISSLAPGEYLVRLYTSDNHVYNAQFIKLHK